MPWTGVMDSGHERVKRSKVISTIRPNRFGRSLICGTVQRIESRRRGLLITRTRGADSPHTTGYEHILSGKSVTSAAFQEGYLNTNITHPSKIVGRIVLGPRQVRNGYARIVATANGSGRIEILNSQSGAWCDADGGCTFSELWSAPPIGDCTYL